MNIMSFTLSVFCITGYAWFVYMGIKYIITKRTIEKETVERIKHFNNIVDQTKN